MDIELIDNLLNIDGKYYKAEYKDGIPKIVRVNKKDVEKKKNLVKRLAKDLQNSLDKEIIMREALGKMRFKDLQQLEKLMKSKRQYKPKTREGACADMKVGNFIIPIVE